MIIKKEVLAASIAGAFVSLALSYGLSLEPNVCWTVIWPLLAGSISAYLVRNTDSPGGRFDMFFAAGLSALIYVAGFLGSVFLSPGTEERLTTSHMNASAVLASNAYVFIWVSSYILAGVIGGVIISRFYKSKTITKKS